MVYFFYRITPTCVGSTFKKIKKSVDARDHPHVCGKYSTPSSIDLILSGSPPRVWEVHQQFYISSFVLGITPTCVGSTLSYSFTSSLQKDHPHVCGKYVLNSRWSTSFTGSPPRVWEVQCWHCGIN